MYFIWPIYAISGERNYSTSTFILKLLKVYTVRRKTVKSGKQLHISKILKLVNIENILQKVVYMTARFVIIL